MVENREVGLERLSSLDTPTYSEMYLSNTLLKKSLTTAAEAHANGELLDIGCGNKPYEVLFKKTTTKYIGCDIVQSSRNCVDVICPSNALKFADNHFDTVLTTQVIEHVESPAALLKEAYRVLKPDGVIIVTGPFFWQLHEEPYDFFRFTKYGFETLLKDAGFKNIKIDPVGGKWTTLAQMFLNVVYSAFKKKKWWKKPIKFLFIHLRGTWMINKIALWLDRKNYDSLLTLNYIVVAKK